MRSRIGGGERRRTAPGAPSSRARAGRRRGPCPAAARTAGRGTAARRGADGPVHELRARTRSAICSVASHASGSSRKTSRISSRGLQVELVRVEPQPVRVATAASAAGCRAGRRGASRPRVQRVVEVVRGHERRGRSGRRARRAWAGSRRCSARPWSWSSMKKFPAPKMSRVRRGHLVRLGGADPPSSSCETSDATGTPRARSGPRACSARSSLSIRGRW